MHFIRGWRMTEVSGRKNTLYTNLMNHSHHDSAKQVERWEFKEEKRQDLKTCFLFGR